MCIRDRIHAQRQAAPGIGAGGTEFGVKPLSNRLQRRETVAGLHGMDANAAGVEMIDRREHPNPALIHGFHPDAIGTPPFVRAIRGNRSVVEVGRTLGPPMVGQQVVVTHQAQYARASDADIAQNTQPRPALSLIHI